MAPPAPVQPETHPPTSRQWPVSWLRPRNLNQALGLLLMYVTVPLLLGALALLVAQGRHEQQVARTQLSALAQTLVQAVDRELDHGKAQLEVIAASRIIDEQDWAQLYAFGREVTSRKPGSLLALVGPDGGLLLNTGVPWGTPLPNLWRLGDERREVPWEGRTLPLSSQSLTRDVFDRNQVIYSDLYYGALISRPTVSLAMPVLRDGKVAYALLLSIPPALIEELIRSSINVPGLRATVVDRQGRVVASNAAAASRLGDLMPTDQVPANTPTGFYERTSADGVPVHGAYAVSAVNGYLVRVSLPVSQGYGALRDSSTRWLVLVVFALLFSAALTGLLGRKLAQPLRALGEAARDGKPPPQAPTGIAEIDLLAQALRTGAENERRHREELVISTQREQTEIELRKADRQKDEFLATLAHELRNPLAPIRTAVELIRQLNPVDPGIRRARDIIERQATQLSRLVDDLLEVSRITLGTIALRREPLDLGALASGAAESVRPTLAGADLRLALHIGPDAVFVSGDATRLSQCVVNLLNNAAKFTPPGGQVVLRVGRADAVAYVEVEDTGIGIAPVSLERIFELFAQENPSGSHGHTGLGIGLALTRRLIDLHQGTVRAFSAGLGQGSRFRIELPVVQEGPSPTFPAGDSPAAQVTGTRVLVVDDNVDAAETLSEMLALGGFASDVAFTGETAIARIERDAPDAVLLDIGLPDIDGYEVCRRIRKLPGIRQPRLIALTGWGQEKNRNQALEAGFDAHLTKPAEPQQVIALLNGEATPVAS